MQRLIAAVACFAVASIFAASVVVAEGQSNYTIIPGERAGDILVGAKYAQQPSQQGVELEKGADGKVKKIRIDSPRYAVQYNQLRVGESMQKIFRYYENLNKSDSGRDRILLRADKEGIEFIVNRTREVIEQIGVFEAAVPASYKQQVKPDISKQPATEREKLKSHYIDSFK